MKSATLLCTLGLTAALSAQAPTVQISIGVRETGAGGGTFSAVGGNGGFTGGIEWINLDGQTLTLDGSWQQFTFDIANDPITTFAGSTANGVIEGTFGTLEHIRVLNNNGVTTPMQLWVDDVTNTTTAGGAVNFGDFETFSEGDEVMFQEPDFSGSTAGNILAGSTTGVDTFVASRTTSDRSEFQFIDNMPTRWVRMTTFNSLNLPNPLIRFDDNSVVTFWMRGGVCQPNLGSQGPGTAIAELCGEGLATGQASTYYVANAPLSAPGAIAISLSGSMDVPVLGGNLVSFGGFLASATILSDPTGKFTLPINGQMALLDLTLQTVFLDVSLPQALAFTNAVNAGLGR